MLTLKELTAKNFMSIGNVVQSINFNQEQLTLVLGENLDQGGDDSGSRNGVGKCVCGNALIYYRNTSDNIIHLCQIKDLYDYYSIKSSPIDLNNPKFISSYSISDLEIYTDTGWQPINLIHKTVPYQVWYLKTETNKELYCADDHILFNENYDTVFVKDLTVNSFIITKNGIAELLTEVVELDRCENMYDISVNDTNHRYYTNSILSHNTTIVNALSYALYGQALSNIKKNNLINKTNNKGMLVTLLFQKNNTLYKIERGRSPNILKFYIDDQEQEITDESQGDSRKTQEFINTLLEMSHDMFKHIIALNTYSEPFLSLRANDQRAIIEQLLGITQLSEKAELLKEETKYTKNLITEESARISAIKHANEKISHTIHSLKTKQHAWHGQQQLSIKNLKKSIEEYKHLDIDHELELHHQLEIWNKKDKLTTALTKEKSTLVQALTRSQQSIEKIKSAIIELDNTKCYACGQELHETKKQEIIETKSKDLLDIQTYEADINSKLIQINTQLEEIGELDKKPITFYDTITDAYEHKTNLEKLEHALVSKIEEPDPYNQQILELEAEAIQEIDFSIINDLESFKEHQEFLTKLLTNKDSFIRKKIIDQNLSFLNNRLTYYLHELGLPHQVTFQNDLSVEITQFGQDLDFHNLSRGESNRLILGLSFAFRDVWENLYQHVNVMFIDELIDSGLDASGVDNALHVLKKMSRDRNKNIFLISHKDELVSRVNFILKVVKESGFTSFATDIEIIN